MIAGTENREITMARSSLALAVLAAATTVWPAGADAQDQKVCGCS
jgi:hypothetical protein